MASSKTSLKISTLILTIIIQQNTEAIKRDPSNLLSLLTNRLHHDKQPLIIVIGKDPAVKKYGARVDQALSAETSGESVHLMHHLLEHDQLMKKAIPYKKSTLKPYHRDEKKSQRFRSQRLREEEGVLQREDKSVLRSPIVKKLLRISNGLRCQAKDECQDKCSNKFGLRAKKCHIQCEIKYVCEEEDEERKEERDSCGEGDDDDSCGGSEEMNGSTRGEKLVTDKP